MDINNNILSITFDSIPRVLAARVRERRLEMNLTQRAMALKSGVALATYRRFETSGEISLRNLVLVAVVLGMTEDFDALFQARRYQSIDEIISRNTSRTRKRGRRNE